MRPAASVVILCHNDGRYVRGCVESVLRHTRASFELIFVDNASQDGIGHELRRMRRTSRVSMRVVRNRENRFFAGGNNQGLALARGRDLVLLNADTVVAPGWLENMAACARRDPRIGLVGPYTNQAAGPQVLWPPAYATLEAMPGWAARRARAFAGSVRRVPWLIGFCLLIPRAAAEALGGLDERFGPGGFEDYDYCLRARLAGYEIAIAEDAYVHHFGGRGYVDMPYDELRARNRGIYLDKWCGEAHGHYAR